MLESMRSQRKGPVNVTGLFSAALCLNERAEDPTTVNGTLSSTAALFLSGPGEGGNPITPQRKGFAALLLLGPLAFPPEVTHL